MLGVLVMAGLGMAGLGMVAAAGLSLTTGSASPVVKDPDWPAWVDKDGQIVPELVPEWIPFQDGLGVVHRNDLYPAIFAPDRLQEPGKPFQIPGQVVGPKPIYDRPGGNVIGHYYADHGFVPIEVEQAPGFDASALPRTPQPNPPPSNLNR